MKTGKYILLILLLGSRLTLCATQKSDGPSYNVTRAREAIKAENYDEALDYLNKEVDDNPHNAYAHVTIAQIREAYEQYGKAITAINRGLQCIPKKNKEYKAYAYSIRGDIYLNMEDSIQALDDLTRAIELDPTDMSYFASRGDLYYDMGKYDLSDLDYKTIVQKDPGDLMGYMGLGRNANARHDYEKGIEWFSKVNKLSTNYSQGYSFRSESYMQLNRYAEAMNDVVMALRINENDHKATYILKALADSDLICCETRLKIQMQKENKSIQWPYYLGVAYEINNQYGKAIEAYKQCMVIEETTEAAFRIGYCYGQRQQYKLSMDYLQRSYELDTTDASVYLTKANLEREGKLYEAALNDAAQYIAKRPDSFKGYSSRGQIYMDQHLWKEAIEEFSKALSIKPDLKNMYYYRGKAHLMAGDEEAASKDLRQALPDAGQEPKEFTPFVYYYLNDTAHALQTQNQLLETGNESGYYYNAACLYALLNNPTKAVEYMRQAFEKGYTHFAHLEQDVDLVNVRENEEMKRLIDQYSSKQEQAFEQDTISEVSYEEKVAEIPFQKENGVCKVKCSINELPLHFIFDTGASDVSISMVEAQFMLKNNYLSKEDIVGKQNYMNANGEINEGTVVILRHVHFGDLTLNNIKASIVKNQQAPLLLGQSVLNKVGKIEIDNEHKVLRITYKKEKM